MREQGQVQWRRGAIYLPILLLLFAANTFAAEKPILAHISSYHEDYSWTQECVNGLKSTLASKYAIHTFYMDTKRRPVLEHQESAERALSFIRDIAPQLIIIGDDNALKLLGPTLAEQDVPVVFYGINGNLRSYFTNSLRPNNVTGILERIPLSQLIRTIVEISPDTRGIHVLTDGGTSGRAHLETSFFGKKVLQLGQVTISYEDHNEWEGWKQAVLEAKEKSQAMVVLAYHTIHDKGQSVDGLKALRWTAENASMPVFLILGDVSDELATGALMVNGKTHGQKAAGLVARVLAGERPSKITPLEDDSWDYVFSKKQLRKFDLSLPKGIEATSILVD